MISLLQLEQRAHKHRYVKNSNVYIITEIWNVFLLKWLLTEITGPKNSMIKYNHCNS